MKLPYIIKRPIMTERSMAAAKSGEYTFEVDKLATKGQIKTAVETYFGVTVDSVRTMTQKGKTKRAGKLRRPTVKADWKKTIIKLKPGQTINLLNLGE